MEQPDLMHGNGCSIHGDCFTCPLAVCRYDSGGLKAKAEWLRADPEITHTYPKAAQRWDSDVRVVRHWYLRGMPAAAIAAAQGMLRSRVMSIIKREGMTHQIVELQRRRVVRFRGRGVKWKDIAELVGISAKACRARLTEQVSRATGRRLPEG